MRRARDVSAKGLAGAGSIPDVGTDNLLTAKKPLGPIGKIGRRGFKTSKAVGQKFSKPVMSGK